MFINRDFSMVNYQECTCHFQRIVASWWVRIYFVEILNYPLYERQLNTSSNQQYITILQVTFLTMLYMLHQQANWRARKN